MTTLYLPTEIDTAPASQAADSTRTAIKFLTTLFSERDLILFRPIETWNESGRKRSRVDYKHTCYRRAVPQQLQKMLAWLIESSAAERTNLFFGVCPRVGDHGRFDLAWQVRTANALWADVDNSTVDESLRRCAERHLPHPSIAVNSGSGVHLYWLLDEPYRIDDVGVPAAVETEWTVTPEGRKRPRRYLLQDGDRIYLDGRRHLSRLSPKATHIQDVLAGIAQSIGGDHTTDLSRLLRLPGTLNRKNERNGRGTQPTELVLCDSTRRYSLSAFEPFAAHSPETTRNQQIAAMPLPQARKPSPTKTDKLAELIATSAIAPAGSRSEADFAVCCFAVRNGISKDHLWNKVGHVGKFAEQGRRYFDLTWENAEYEVRAVTYQKLQRQAAPDLIPTATGEPSDDDPRPTIHVEPRTTPVALTMEQITDHLLVAGNCYTRVEQTVVIDRATISPILSAAELAGVLNQHVEFLFVGEKGGEYKPLPPAYGNTWLNHATEQQRLPAIRLFTHNPVFTEDWRFVAPGYDPKSGIYYAGPAIACRQGTEHLDALLYDFCFKTPADRTNYLGILLTTLLVPQFIGSKPAALFNGNQPELGKSILAQIVAILRDGQPVETATYNPNDEEFEKRLGAIVRRGGTTIIIDNAKARGRSPRIESACLERSITDPILSFRLLGFSQEIRAENSHIFCITANTPDVSRDLVTRSVVINLYYEGDPERRNFSIADPESYAQQHRTELLGELVGMVERWKSQGMPLARVHSRFNKRGWGTIVGGILDACGEPDFLDNLDEDSTQLDETRRSFAELVSLLGEHTEGHWTASELVDLCRQHQLLGTELGEGSRRAVATKMGTLASRFVNERFSLGEDRFAAFHKAADRNGNRYYVELRNLNGFAEPMRNLGEQLGSAL